MEAAKGGGSCGLTIVKRMLRLFHGENRVNATNRAETKQDWDLPRNAARDKQTAHIRSGRKPPCDRRRHMSRWLRRDEEIEEKGIVPLTKKLVKILIIISIVALVLMIILEVVWGNKGPREEFINSWVSGILILLAIPLMLGIFSLAFNADRIKPKAWLIIYGCAVAVYMTIIIKAGFINETKDLPLAIKEDYSVISGSVEFISFKNNIQIIEVEGLRFIIPRDIIKKMELRKNVEYTFYYLPNTRTVMNIVKN